MTRFVYPVTLEPDEDGVFIVEFPDFDFAVTDGADVAAALIRAADCLEEALACCIDEGWPIPAPSRKTRGMFTVAPGPLIAAKAALYAAVREAGMSKVALAKRLAMDEKDIRRMLNPRYATKIPALARALAALGKRLEITVADQPPVPARKKVA